MKGIILAAGIGNRLSPLTKTIPKFMIPFCNKSLFERNLDIFTKCGIDESIVVIRPDINPPKLSNVKYVIKEKVKGTNMLYSLFCAEKFIESPTVISYGDIIFEKKILDKLLESTADISIVVDVDWIKYFKYRIDDPINDAHECIVANGDNVTSIGLEVENLDDVDGHFIGLMKIQNNGIKILKDFYHKSKLAATETFNPLNPNLPFESSRLVDLIQGLISSGVNIKLIPIQNGWLEFDTVKDYEIYKDMEKKGSLSNLIKLE
jgi:choline kinase